MRLFSTEEKNKVKELTSKSISLAFIEPTTTALKKSIMDATAPLREYFKSVSFHNYDEQYQGTEHKVVVDGIIYLDFQVVKTKVSLYRPNTKKGDPRIWISKLPKYSNPNDIIGLIYYDNKLHIFNITQLNIIQLLGSKVINPFQELIIEISDVENKISNELLQKLTDIAGKGLIPSIQKGDTSVGSTLEDALGISMNSSKKPDYKGIELKSFRSRRNNRKNLFCQVPNWKLSKFKSATEILDNYGYYTDSIFRLYCTMSTKKANPQGLILEVDEDAKQLLETHEPSKQRGIAVWELSKLHARLLEKHNETFWIEADSEFVDGKEFFQYTKVEHTRKPIITQFDLLLSQGVITLDHLIKRNDKSGKGNDKGPSFKIQKSGIELLFPPSLTYSLID